MLLQGKEGLNEKSEHKTACGDVGFAAGEVLSNQRPCCECTPNIRTHIHTPPRSPVSAVGERFPREVQRINETNLGDEKSPAVLTCVVMEKIHVVFLTLLGA